MPTPKKPSVVHELKGSYKKNPQRKNNAEPSPEGELGLFVENPSIIRSEVWEEIAGVSVPGLLTNMDTIWIELVVDLLIQHRTGEITSSDRGQLLKLLGGIGFNPVDRSRIGIQEKPKVNRFKEVM